MVAKAVVLKLHAKLQIAFLKLRRAHVAQISMQEALENPFVASMLPCGFRTTVKHYIKKGSQKSFRIEKKG
jgi:hypothetical protein